MDNAELLERAALYRAMAKQALRAELSSEFTARAERYEVAAQALRRAGKAAAAPSRSGCPRDHDSPDALP